MSSLTSAVMSSNIKIIDQLDGLDLYHFSGSIPENSEDANYRGIIKNGEKIVVKTFPFTPEIAIQLDQIDNVKENEVYKQIITKNYKIFTSYEGSLLRIFHHNDKWYLCTHKKLDAFTSRWGCEFTYGELFLKCLGLLNNSDINTFDSYTNQLDKNLTYVFLIRNFKLNRIVCKDYEEPKAYTIGAFNNNTQEFIFKTNETLNESLFECPDEIENSDLNTMVEHIQNIDINKTQGIILIDENGVCLKLLNKKYNDLFLSRNNQPNVLFRYIQLYKEVKENLVDYSVLESYKELYTEYIDTFNDYHTTIEIIIQNIYQKYIDRFIYKKIAITPPEQYNIIKKLHSQFLSSNYKDKITLEKVKIMVHSSITNILFNLYILYKDRLEKFGDGNSIEENKTYVTSCINNNA